MEGGDGLVKVVDDAGAVLLEGGNVARGDGEEVLHGSELGLGGSELGLRGGELGLELGLGGSELGSKLGLCGGKLGLELVDAGGGTGGRACRTAEVTAGGDARADVTGNTVGYGAIDDEAVHLLRSGVGVTPRLVEHSG